ncbi:MAG: flagellar basal body L-ring protein FlgH [Phycisphaerales bacterium]
MNAKLLTAAALLLPATLHAQSLFHAPLPPQAQQQTPAFLQPPAPPAAAPAPAQPANGTPAPNQPAPITQPQAGAGQPAPAPAPAPQAGEQQAAVMSPTAGFQPALPSAEQVSLFAVKPIKPHKFSKQDKVQIIVNETSLAKFEQKADNKESADINAALKDLPNLMRILTDGTLENTGAVTPKIGFGNGSKYKGEGSYERTDKFTARISAIVTDVKPNGMLVLEARETILSDKESKSMVVSGICDPKDITNMNTVQSSQLANLVIRTEHAGDVKDAATKGWLPKIFDTITGNNP